MPTKTTCTGGEIPAPESSLSCAAPCCPLATLPRKRGRVAGGQRRRQRRTSAPLIIEAALFFIALWLARNSCVTARALTLLRIHCGLLKVSLFDRVLVALVLPSKSPMDIMSPSPGIPD